MSANDLSALTARAEELCEDFDGRDHARIRAFIRDLLTYATTVTQERDEARKVVENTLWMAGRYADGRMTYAVGRYNDMREIAQVRGGYDGSAKSAIDGMAPEWPTLKERLATAEQERDAAIASARAAAQRAQHLDTIRRAIAKSPENCPVCHSAMVEHVHGCIAAFDHAQQVDPPSMLGRRCFECPGTIVAACNRCGQKYATPIAQETPR